MTEVDILQDGIYNTEPAIALMNALTPFEFNIMSVFIFFRNPFCTKDSASSSSCISLFQHKHMAGAKPFQPSTELQRAMSTDSD